MAETARTVYRSAIPVDDIWHEVHLTGPILHIDCRRHDAVEIWSLHNEGEPAFVRQFQVFGTGHPLPADAGRHVGTVLSPAVPPVSRRGALVWHVFERVAEEG